MRFIRSVLLVGVAFQATAAIAADQLKFGKPPEWVVPQGIPAANSKTAQAPAVILLMDQQTRLETDRSITYAEVAIKIQNAQGLAVGNLSIPWNPATDTATVNKLEIHRGDQVIDVLKSGQTFTTMRRETNLELAMLDGVLTANIQPEGLREGDVVVMATTVEHADPVLKGHVEADFAGWGEMQIGLAHARLIWPQNLNLKTQKTGDLPQPQQQTARDGLSSYDLTMRNAEPVIPPKGAPLRFKIGRLGEATDFKSWAEAARLMMPLYNAAAVIPPAGPLREELEQIRKSSPDPHTRAALALRLAQDRVRYVALSMGEGGLVPASAETTWARRFGDCKAKTALLLALLHELGITAEPVAANIGSGDAITGRLPMIGVFNHVLVRAHIAGKDYWLDGTRTGDTDLDTINTPDFGWVLPLTENAQLVHLVPAPLAVPDTDTTIMIDASKGVRAPVGIEIDQMLRGDGAIGFNSGMGALTDAQRTAFFDEYWKRSYDFVTPGPTDTNFDPVKKVYRISMRGTGKLDWNSGWFHMPNSTVGFDASFERTSGNQQDAPIAVNYPSYSHTLTTIRFPPGFFGSRPTGNMPTTRETLAGIEYLMHVTHESGPAGDTLTIETSEHSLVPEVPYKDAIAAEPRLRELADQDSAIPLPRYYRPTKDDLTAWLADKPSTANAYIDRGNALMDAHRYDEAISDFDQAIFLEPKSVIALADRGIAYVWMRKNDLAEKDLSAAAAIEPENAIVHRARGLKAEFAGDYAAAVEAYTRSLKTEPRNAFAFGHRAMCENMLGRHSEAIADADQAMQIDPAWRQLRAIRLDGLAQLGQKDAAAREAEELVKQNPQSVAATWIGIAQVYNRAGLKAEAFAAIDKALATKAEPSTYILRAQLRPFTDFKDRMADIEAALKLEPLDTSALGAKADLLADQGDLKAALAIYDNALKTRLSVPRGILLYRLGHTADGERILSAWRQGAFTATELNELCWRKATAGILLQSALKDCNDALHINPAYVPAMDSLAFATLRLGKFQEAVTLYDRAVAKAPQAASYMGRALAYRGLGDSSKASADRSEALKRDAGIETRFASYGLKFDQSPATTAKAQ